MASKAENVVPTGTEKVEAEESKSKAETKAVVTAEGDAPKEAKSLSPSKRKVEDSTVASPMKKQLKTDGEEEKSEGDIETVKESTDDSKENGNPEAPADADKKTDAGETKTDDGKTTTEPEGKIEDVKAKGDPAVETGIEPEVTA